jgi:hypothetical protein
MSNGSVNFMSDLLGTHVLVECMALLFQCLEVSGLILALKPFILTWIFIFSIPEFLKTKTK